MRQQNSKISLETIEFIFRHPWLFICPTVIIFSLAYGFIINSTLFYKSSAVISFEPTSEELLDKRFTQTTTQKRRDELIGKVLLGDNINKIIEAGWPSINKTSQPVKYFTLVENLRNSKTGIQMKFERDPRLLTISYSDTSRTTCYKVVKAVVDTIIRETLKEKIEKSDSGIAFFKKQIELYQDKLNKLDEQIIRLKNEVSDKLPELSNAEKDSLRGLISEAGSKSRETSFTEQKIIKYNGILTDLELQLLEVEKKKSLLENQLKTNAPTLGVMPKKDLREDPIIQEYNKAIVAKEVEITRLISQGWTPEHPEIKRLQREIEVLKETKSSRIEELRGLAKATPESDYNEQKEEIKLEIRNLEFQIAALKDKKTLIESYRETEEKELKRPEIRNPEISKRVSKLIELQNEKQVSLNYSTELRNKLEEEEIKSRLEKEKAGVSVKLVEAPQEPVKSTPFQKMPKLFMALMFSLGAGGGIAYVVDSLDQSIRTSAELRELLQVPVLGTVDRIISPQEVKKLHLQRIFIFTSLIIFALVSNILIKVFFSGKGIPSP